MKNSLGSAVFGLLAATAVFAQAPANIRVDKKLVLVPVSVIDSENRPVAGLAKSNFRVFDDKTEQPIETFSMEDQPIAVGVIFDVSGSMGRKLRYSRMALKAFLDTANSQDEFCLIEFSGVPKVTVPLTADSTEIEARASSSQSRGRTALLDAIYLGLHEIRKSNKPRKALLIVSDGGDNHSRYREREIRDLVRESDVLIYSMGVYEPLDLLGRTPEELAGPGLLKEISEESGGREYSVGYMTDLAETARSIGLALRNLYVVGFSPAEKQPDDRYHNLRVKIVRTHGLPPIATWRPGYYATGE